MRTHPTGHARRGPARRWAIVALAAAGCLLPGCTRTEPRGTHALHGTEATRMSPTSDAHGRTPNQLVHEQSPYLLQHAYNPVDWHPWGEEAFAKARREDRPIFLSIGYSTCHWCHVMERESFEDDSVAALLNANFVCIKVDREERPDVDRIYMTAMQALGMGGGWPLNVFLTPDLEPFFGGTYFPPRTRAGRVGLMELLPQVHQAWLSQRAAIEQQGAQVMRALDSLATPETGPADRAPLAEAAFEALERSHDPEHGGFGSSPKFPSTVNLDFLLRYGTDQSRVRSEALALVTRQLDAMRAGGIHDHLGGGFHRYATDRAWGIPHFEKMLYDQALIASAYLEGYQTTGDVRYAETARDVFRYVRRDLSDPAGGFLSAEDADSEGEEGRFYVWTPAQVESVLAPPEAALFCEAYGVTAHGDFEHGTTVLHEARTVEDLAGAHRVPPGEIAERLAQARAALFAARERRVRPYRDDKVITAWNGLMISACARGARVLGDDALRARAAAAAEFVWAHLRDPHDGALMRRWRAGHVAGAGMLDDHADMALALLDLYAADHDPRWLARAVELTGVMIARFEDRRDGGFYESPAGDPSVKVRMKNEFDGAEVAGNSIAVQVVQTLAELLDRDDWRAVARRALDAYARRLRRAPVAMPRMLCAMQLEAATPRQIVIVGHRDAADTRALARVLDRRFAPYDVPLYVDPAAPGPLADLAPFSVTLPMQAGQATAYVCVDRACHLPVTDPAAFAAQLDEHPRRPLASKEDR